MSVLFREDCFAVKVINRILFGELGKRYLTRVLTSTVKSVLSISYVIDVCCFLSLSLTSVLAVTPQIHLTYLSFIFKVNPNAGIEPKSLQRSTETMTKILSEFLTLFSKSPQFCPVYVFFNTKPQTQCYKYLTVDSRLLREVFAAVQTSLNNKYGKDNKSPLVLDFIFFKFMCPALIDPIKYELIDGT